jgi:hypothetical protein
LLLLLFWFGSTAAQAADWTWQNPLPQGNTLYGVWGSSGSNVFAVGSSGTILHYGNELFSSGFESGGLEGWSGAVP